MYFRKRSHENELLDQDGIPFEDLQLNMKELDFINTWLGGHRITANGLKILLQNRPEITEVHICEIGCGGGDNLRVLEKCCEKHGLKARFTGIDIKEACIRMAAERSGTQLYNWIISDYRFVEFGADKPDIIFSSLFCHHFSDPQLESMMQWMQRNSSIGFFINDLHRHAIAYYAIQFLTKLFSKSYLVKNDAPLSVKRGFIKKDWQSIMQRSGIENYSIEWKWAFRWLITTR